MITGLTPLISGTAPSRPNEFRVFLLIGQSNMAGRGAIEPSDQVPHPRVFALNKGLAWIPAVDPLHFDKPGAGVGLGSNFGRVLADADTSATIGLVPAAVGGTSLDQWQAEGEHFRNAVDRTRVALKQGRLAGILWHQGEADSAPEKAATYAARFAAIIARLRADLNAPGVPVIVGGTGRFRENGKTINLALSVLPRHVPDCVFVSAEGLRDRGDKLHFDSASLRECGRRFARAWLAHATRSGEVVAPVSTPGSSLPFNPPTQRQGIFVK
jgi:hypothetical protein